jgi:surface polysaccharide O-acyltransferase-like enzyme
MDGTSFDPSAGVFVMEKRIVWCDAARATAIVMVVLVHCVESVYNPNLILSAGDFFSAVSLVNRVTLFTIGRVGVPLFLMLTGYLLLPRHYDTPGAISRFYRHNFLHLLIITEIWTVLYIGYFFLDWQQFSWQSSLRYLLFLEKVPLSHMWYMPVILSLYLSLPLVAIALQRCRARYVAPVLCFVLFTGFLVPTLADTLQCFRIDFPVSFQGVTDWNGGTYGLYLVLGYYLGSKEALRKVSKQALWLTALGCLLLADGVQAVSYPFGSWAYRITYTHPLILVLSIAVFELFRRSTAKPSVKCAKSLEMLSRLSLGVFFIHNPVLIKLLSLADWSSMSRELALPLLLVATLAISYGVSGLLFLFKPFRRWLLKA